MLTEESHDGQTKYAWVQDMITKSPTFQYRDTNFNMENMGVIFVRPHRQMLPSSMLPQPRLSYPVVLRPWASELCQIYYRPHVEICTGCVKLAQVQSQGMWRPWSLSCSQYHKPILKHIDRPSSYAEQRSGERFLERSGTYRELFGMCMTTMWWVGNPSLMIPPNL